MGQPKWQDVDIDGIDRTRVRLTRDRRVTGLMIEADDITSETIRLLSLPRLVAKALWYESDRQLLGRPSGLPHDDTFYASVADAYRSATCEDSRPAVLLAEENHVPVETVRRWVKEARRRGLLAHGRKGRAI